MKSISFVILLFFFFSLKLSSQVPSVLWSRCYGGSQPESGLSLEKTFDGGFILAGVTTSDDGQVTGHNPGICGWFGWPDDFWVVKVDSSGNLEWQKCLGGSCEDFASSILQTSDSGYIVCGTTFSNDSNVIGNHGIYDIWVVKIDKDGNIVWQRCYGGSNYEYSYSIAQSEDGGFIISGVTTSNDGDVSGIHSPDTADIWIVKTDNTGSIEWQKCLGGSENEGGYVMPTSSAEYFVYGSTKSNDGDVTFNHSVGLYDYWLAKMDNIGNLLWQHSYGGINSEEVHGAQLVSDGGFIVCGTTISNDGDVTGNHGLYDFWIVKTDSLGNLEWQKALGGTSHEYGYAVIESVYGGYIVSGTTFSNDWEVSGNHGDFDAWLVKLDSTGQIEWQKCLGGSGAEAVSSLYETTFGEIVGLGYSDSGDGDLLSAGVHGAIDMWLIKLESPYVGVFKPSNPITDFTSYYYSATNVLLVNFYANGNEDVQLQFFDLTGRLLFLQSLAVTEGFNKQEISAPDITAGIYIVKLAVAGGGVCRKLVVANQY